MNLTNNSDLRNAVTNFSWHDQEIGDHPLIHDVDLNAIVNEISKKIIAASQMKPIIEERSNRKLSLLDVCYLIVQDKDKNKETQTLIQQASSTEKIITHQTFQRLSQSFTQVESSDLRAITLLFGIQRIHELTAQKIIAFSHQTPKKQELEDNIKRLVMLRNQYPNPSELRETDKKFLKGVDEKIKEMQELLEALNLSLDKQVI